ncbi:hypothetical protein CIB84_005451 [Bambusicola thoracicus]|uniref:Uncharacterized protein n=1 Tax=Bambusicola thoracicus TaxID=9083 RepID=A0A2P4T357_BAMTH|nr:hypothetical protein CIB84_005451 [Bambusicola thoracicus]
MEERGNFQTQRAHHCNPKQIWMAWDSLCGRDLLRPTIRRASSIVRTGQRGDTPSLEELRRLLWTRARPMGHVDEVWPNLYVGDL